MDPQTTRRKQFKAALALAGVTAKDWAEAQSVSPVHVHYVLNGERESPRIDAAIDALIAQYAPAAQAA